MIIIFTATDTMMTSAMSAVHPLQPCHNDQHRGHDHQHEHDIGKMKHLSIMVLVLFALLQRVDIVTHVGHGRPLGSGGQSISQSDVHSGLAGRCVAHVLVAEIVCGGQVAIFDFRTG